MDPQIEELKQLLQQNIAIAQDNNRMLRAMRRGAWISGFMRLVWIAFIVGASFAAYYYMLPYIRNIEEMYTQILSKSQQAQDYGSQISDFLKSLPGVQQQ